MTELVRIKIVSFGGNKVGVFGQALGKRPKWNIVRFPDFAGFSMRSADRKLGI